MKNKLYNRNFVMVIAGQLVSVFGNSVLRFCLPLYILDKTGSAAIFGTVLALSTIPAILFSPLGGILADRCNKRNLMVILDMITAVIIAVCTLMLGSGYVLLLVAVMMALFSVIQSIYQPVVQASIPAVTDEKNLEKANGTVSLVNALSNLLAPVAAGVLYGVFGITYVMVVGGICFLLASIMELLIKIEFVRNPKSGSPLEAISLDLKESFRYIIRENPALLRIIIIVSFVNLTLTSMILVGLPSIIRITLGLSSELYGMTQGMIALGMIAGGALSFVIGRKIQMDNIHRLLMLTCLSLFPMGLVFTLNADVMVSYWVISVFSSVMMLFVTVFSIKMMSFVQRNTPVRLIGKVISFILMMTKCSLPVGQALYGFIFNVSGEHVSLVIFGTALCSIIITLYSKKAFKNFGKTGLIDSKTSIPVSVPGRTAVQTSK